jgi:energy-coupling factor transporter ATP-binding protein EcfA2
MDFSHLQFGKPAAERDLEHLKDYFIESGTYSRVAKGSKRFLLGNRGSGKSAIFKMIAAREKAASNVVIELSPEDYSYQMLEEIVAGEADGNWAKSGAYAAAWKYLILVLAMKKLAKLPRHKERWKKDEKRMFRYLANNHANVAEQPLDLLISYLRRLEGVKIGPYEAGIKSSELIRLYKLEELEPYIPVVVDMCRRTQVSVFVDELDKGWDASEDAKAFVAGLFQACTTLNDLSPKFRVFVSLRQELYDNIPALYDDTQKYRDLFETISWGSDDLWTMMANRIRHYVPALKSASDEEAWMAVFEERDSFNHMLDRTLYRPRELILYASEALEQTRSAKGRIPISRETVRGVEVAFSTERTRDLAAEYRWQYPGLESVFASFRSTRKVWMRDDLLMHLLDVSVGSAVQSLDRPQWVDGIDPERLLDVLWRVGFLTVVGDGDSHAGVRPGSPEDPRVDIRRAEHLQIAPLFHRGLGFE